MRNMLRTAATAVLMMISFVAGAWDSSIVAISTLSSDFHPLKTTQPDATGFWASGLANGNPVLVRYDANSSPKIVRHPHWIDIDNGEEWKLFALAAYPDGGVISLEFNLAGCMLQRYAADGRMLWKIRAGDSGFGAPAPCIDQVQVDGGGNIWLASTSSGIVAIAPDGAVLANNFKIGITADALVADRRAAGAFVAGCSDGCYLDLSTGTTHAVVAKILPQGVQWTTHAPGTAFSTTLSTAIVGTDGNLYAFGQTLASTGGRRILFGMSVSAEGSLRWTQSFDTSVEPASILTAPLNNGDIAVLHGSPIGLAQAEPGITPALARISASGSLLWQKSTGFTATAADGNFASLGIATSDNKDTIATLVYSGTSPEGYIYRLRQSRFDTNGNALYSDAALPNSHSADITLQALPDSTSLTTNGTFTRIGRNGAAAPPPQSAAIIPAGSFNDSETISEDGSVFVLSINADAKSYSVSTYSSDGSLRWSRVATSSWAEKGLLNSQLAATATQVCWAGYLDGSIILQCYARDTGIPATPITLTTSASWITSYARLTALADGSIVVLYPGTDGNLHHALFDPQTTLVHDIALLKDGETAGISAINASGDSLIQTSATTLSRFNAAGQRTYDTTTDIQSYSLRLLKDGTAILCQRRPSAAIERLGSDGHLLWKTSLTPPFTDGAQRQASFNLGSLQTTTTDVYVYVYDYYTLVSGTNSRVGYVFKLDLQTGKIGWNIPAPFPLPVPTPSFIGPPHIVLDATTQRLVLLTNYKNKIGLQTLSMTDGSELAYRFESMGVDDFVQYQPSIGKDGKLRIVSGVSDSIKGSAWQIDTLDHPFDVPAPTRIDQPGIAGTWYAPYSTGQGFTLDYIAGANTVFMPWFTFSQTQTNDPSSVAWFTLQGQPGTGATSVDLGMYVSDAPGTFNAGKTGAKKVGTATLSFSDCSRGTLRYQFDANTNGGANGVVTLTRLTPQASPCLLADGSTQTISVNAPAQGFDARQSGSWYDPNISGQGIELTVAPAGNGSNGLLFGAWFTYDPTGAGNDALNQHWFTLQGDLATAQNGKVTLPILQALGGTFDGAPTRNASQVGVATLIFSGCDQARIDYQFADTAVAHAYAGLSGSLRLTKIGGCGTP